MTEIGAIGELRLGAQAIRCAIERRSSQAVIHHRRVRVLPSATSADGEVATSFAGTARTSTAASAGRSEATGPPSAWKAPRSAGRTEPFGEFSRQRIEFAPADRFESLVQHAAIEAGHVPVHRHRLRRAFRTESRRKEQPRGILVGLGRRLRRGAGRLFLNRQRFERPRGRRLRSLRRGRWRAWRPRFQCELKIDRTRTNFARDRQRLFDALKARQLGSDLICARLDRELI